MSTADRPLPISRPSAQGVDARGIVAFLDAVDGVQDTELHSVMLLRHGFAIAQGWWEPYAPDRVHLLYSLSKSFAGTAAGLAVSDGLVDLDAAVVSYFPEFQAEITDPRSRDILVRHVASMSAGHTDEQLDIALTTDVSEPVRGFLLNPPDGTSGLTFAYSQPTTYTLAAIVQRLTGGSLTEYLRPRVLDPLGVGETAWRQHPPGREIGFSGMFATTDTIARLGQLYLQRGVWNGVRLLDETWVDEATRPQVDNAGGSADPDWQQGYGFQFWMSRHGYRGDGAYGQFCVVLPEQDAVLAITSDTVNMQAILNAAWTHLLPAFEGRGSEAADATLDERLADLALPFPEVGSDFYEGAFEAADTAIASLTRLTVGGDKLTLHQDDGSTTVVDIAPDRWRTTGYLAARAGMTDARTLLIHLQFVETPHRLTLSCSLTDHTFTAAWRTEPLGQSGQLADLRAPAPKAR